MIRDRPESTERPLSGERLVIGGICGKRGERTHPRGDLPSNDHDASVDETFALEGITLDLAAWARKFLACPENFGVRVPRS
jgi:hypothetical protein